MPTMLLRLGLVADTKKARANSPDCPISSARVTRSVTM
jgi:hypothetical protein